MNATRSQARKHLHGHWKSAILVQTICMSAEIIIIGAEASCYYRFNNILLFLLALLADLFFLSPLQAGRALFYETLITQAETATAKQIGHFFRNGYARCVGWRFELWLRRIVVHGLLCIPSSVFLYISRIAERKDLQAFAMTSFAFSLIFLASSFIITEILLFRYIPAVYLLKQVKSAKFAMRLSKRISKGYTRKWATLYLDYAGWCFSLFFLFPVFYVSPLFHTARAATVHRLFLSNSHQIR